MTSLGQRFHRWRFAVLGGWLVTLVGLAVLAIGMGTAFTDSTNLPDSDSATAYRLLAESGAAGTAASADVKQGAIAWHTVAVDDPAVRAEFSAMLREIDTMPGVTSVSPYEQAGAAQVDKTAHTAYASITLGKDADAAAPPPRRRRRCAAAASTSRSAATGSRARSGRRTAPRRSGSWPP